MKEEKDIIEGNKLADFLERGYQIFASGKVLGKRGTYLKLGISTSGYYQISAWNKGNQKTFLLHRILAEAFIPNPENKAEVNHKDGNKLNNSLENLEWVSRSENIRHGIINGLIPSPWKNKSGSLHTRSKTVLQLKDNQIISEFGSSREAARETGISYGTISNVLLGTGKTAGGYSWKYKS